MLGIAIALSLAAGQQVELKFNTGAGAKHQVDVASEVSIEIQAVDRENPAAAPRKRDVTTRLREVYVQEIAAADNGVATRFTLQCQKSQTEREGSDIKATGLQNTPRQGKTILVVRDAKGHAVTVGTEPGTSQDAYVGRWEAIGAILPNRKAGLNDTWKVAGADKIGALLFVAPLPRPPGPDEEAPSEVKPAAPQGDLECKVVKVEGETATIQFAGTLSADPSEDAKLTLGLSGTLVFDGARGRPVSLQIKGDLSFTRTVYEDEFRPEIQSEFRVYCGTISVRSKKCEVALAFKDAE